MARKIHTQRQAKALPNRQAAIAGTPGQRIKIYNKSGQMVPLQIQVPGSDFYDERQVHLSPGKSVTLDKSQVRLEQISNLKRMGILTVSYDSEK